MFDKRTGVLQHALSAVMDEVRLTRVQDGIAAGLDVADVLAAERQGKLLLDTNLLNSQQLGAVRIAAKGAITVDSALQVADGGNITLFGKDVTINASLRSHGGSIAAGNVLSQIGPLGMLDTYVNPGAPRAGWCWPTASRSMPAACSATCCAIRWPPPACHT